jgi:toxin CcdB
MAQFDVYENRNYRTRHSIPYYLDVQSDLLESFVTRIVVPLISKEHISHPVDILNPTVRIGRENLYLSSAQICSVHKSDLGKRITNITRQCDVIHSSMSILFGAD